MKPTFFRTAADLRAWFAENHATARELVIGFYKVASGKPSVRHPEALDEALCVGWIDGIRKGRDATSYVQRFAPRQPKSFWSQVNIARVKKLIAEGRMTSAGLAAFEARDESRTKKVFNQRDAAAFDAQQLRQLKSNRKAWSFFEAQPPGYKRLMTIWVTSGKQEATRAMRLAKLIDISERGKRIDPMKSSKNQ